MSRSHTSKSRRELVTKDAGHRCGYCQTSEFVTGATFEMDHILPESLGGRTERGNLWLCCGACNERKGNRTSAIDKRSGARVRLFHPRHDQWSDHFRWIRNGEVIDGKTSIDRATVETLEMNRPVLVAAQRDWIAVGWHPPKLKLSRVRRRPR